MLLLRALLGISLAVMPDYQAILEKVHEEVIAKRPEGRVASYIPGLAKVSPDKFGMHLHTAEGEDFSVGDSTEAFSIQSITKVLLLGMVASTEGEKLWRRVGVEASGDPFNSLIQLETERGIPRNPFINAGALVLCDVLVSIYGDPKAEFLKFVRRISGVPCINYDRYVAKSELDVAYRNLAMVNFMKSFRNIHNDVGSVIDFYCFACSIRMSCGELAQTFGMFMNHGRLANGDEVLAVRSAKRINALMLTCGFYDESGEFAFRVGLPGKAVSAEGLPQSIRENTRWGYGVPL